MVEYGCECNFGIPGVDRLPTHDHNQARNFEDMLVLNQDQMDRIIDYAADHWPLRDSIHLWVDWKAVARA